MPLATTQAKTQALKSLIPIILGSLLFAYAGMVVATPQVMVVRADFLPPLLSAQSAPCIRAMQLTRK